MTKDYIEYELDFVKYEVEIIYDRGTSGNYTQAPEPHTLEIIKVYNTETDKFIDYADDIELYDTIDQDVYDMIDRGGI